MRAGRPTRCFAEAVLIMCSKIIDRKGAAMAPRQKVTERQNRWVMTPDQIREAETRYRAPKDSGLVARSVQHFYETDPDVVAGLLPPPLTPGERPDVWVSIGHMPDIKLGVAQVAVACRYRDENG